MKVRRQTKIAVLAVAAALAMVAASCGDDDDTSTPSETTEAAGESTTSEAPTTTVASPPEIVIPIQDDGYEIPEGMETGIFTLIFRNEGTMPHEATISLLKVPLEEYEAMLATGGPASSLTEQAGGVPPLQPGGEARVTVTLVEGVHLMFSRVWGADGKNDRDRGLSMTFPVTAASGPSAEPPAADVEVELVEFGFNGLPETLDAGEHTVAATNAGAEVHEMIVYALLEGATLDDVVRQVDFLSPPPAGSPLPWDPETAAGVKEIQPGATAWVPLDLEPGRYVVYCGTPLLADRTTHASKGMITELTVA